MLKTALIAYGALSIPATIIALSLCRAAARGDRMTEAALRGAVDRDEVSRPEPRNKLKAAA